MFLEYEPMAKLLFLARGRLPVQKYLVEAAGKRCWWLWNFSSSQELQTATTSRANRPEDIDYWC